MSKAPATRPMEIVTSDSISGRGRGRRFIGATFRGDASHHQADLFACELLRLRGSNEHALVHHGDAITQLDDFVQVGRDQQDGLAVVPHLHEEFPNVDGGGDIQPAGRGDGGGHLRAWTNSLCPLPSTPAIPKTSPARTSNDSPLTAGAPWSLAARRSRTTSTGAPGGLAARLTRATTLRPTIISASPSGVAWTVAISPVTCPFRRTTTRSESSRTSFSLWVMNTTDLPPVLSRLRNWERSWTSTGARAEVGSSRMSTEVPR